MSLLAKLGLGDEPITMRMTGCPNGCARPYMAEIGFVGDGPNSYQVRGRHKFFVMCRGVCQLTLLVYLLLQLS